MTTARPASAQSFPAVADLEAIVRLADGIFPDDGDGHCARTIGAVGYIAAQIADPDRDAARFYRDLLHAVDLRADAQGFQNAAAMSGAAIEGCLSALSRGEIGPPGAFARLRRDVIEGLFSDPVHGGNQKALGWRFLGHPGIIAPTEPAPCDDYSDRRVFDGQRTLVDWPTVSESGLPPEFDPRAGRSVPLLHADVVIAGCGAVGAIVAARLAEAGLRVVALEAGPWRPQSAYRPDELEHSFYGRASLGPKFNAETPRWVRRQDDPESRPLSFSLGRMANGVGGSSVLYGARFRRFHPHHMRHLSSLREMGLVDRLPEDATLADWPIGYDALESYYAELEHRIGIAGEPSPYTPRSAPLPHPPLPPFPAGEVFIDAARRSGYTPLAVPVGRSASAGKDGAVSFSPWDEGIGLAGPQRWTPLFETLPAALKSGLLHVRTGCRVLRVMTDGNGVATGLRYLDPDGTVREQSARAVIVSTYTFETVRLLWLSRDRAHPDGLGNSADQLGRHFMAKMFPQVIGQFEDRCFNRHLGPSGQAVIVEDLIAECAQPTDGRFFGGGTMSTENKLLPLQIGLEAPPPGAPDWGAAFKRHLRGWNSRLPVKIQADAMPVANNRIVLDPVARDPATDDPIVRVIWDLPDNDRRLYAHMQDQAAELVAAMGASQLWRTKIETGVGCCHDLGGARAGFDPASSVTDTDWQVHDTANLYVFGGATFPTCPGINPTLTIWAWALRNADRLIGKLSS